MTPRRLPCTPSPVALLQKHCAPFRVSSREQNAPPLLCSPPSRFRPRIEPIKPARHAEPSSHSTQRCQIDAQKHFRPWLSLGSVPENPLHSTISTLHSESMRAQSYLAYSGTANTKTAANTQPGISVTATIFAALQYAWRGALPQNKLRPVNTSHDLEYICTEMAPTAAPVCDTVQRQATG